MTTLSTKIVTSSRFGFGMIDHSKRPIYALKARKRSSSSLLFSSGRKEPKHLSITLVCIFGANSLKMYKRKSSLT